MSVFCVESISARLGARAVPAGSGSRRLQSWESGSLLGQSSHKRLEPAKNLNVGPTPIGPNARCGWLSSVALRRVTQKNALERVRKLANCEESHRGLVEHAGVFGNHLKIYSADFVLLLHL